MVLTQHIAESGDNKQTTTVVVQNDVRVVGKQHQGEIAQLVGRENLEVSARRSTTDRRSSSPFQNGRTELLIGNEENKVKTTAVVESNNNKLGIEPENR